MIVTVLRELLLKQLDNGDFKPKKFKREKVKEVLSYRFEEPCKKMQGVNVKKVA